MKPELYWSPALGHWFHLRPGDIGSLTPAQLSSCIDFIERNTKT